MKSNILDALNKRISDGESHLNYLKNVKKTLESKNIYDGDVAFHKDENGKMNPSIIVAIHIPTFQMFTSGKIEIMAVIRTAEIDERKVLYNTLYKYDEATKVLFK